MARSTLKLIPGVDVTKTPTLNEAALSSSNLIRFMPDRNNLGLVQKFGGWQTYISSPITSTIRALKGWSDLNAINRLGIGATNSLNVYTQSTGNNTVITPQTTVTNFAPVFSTTSGSTAVVVTDSNINTTIYNYVNYVTPVSVGGVVLTGAYATTIPSGTTYDVIASSPATFTENTSTAYTGGAFVVNTTYKIVTIGGTSFTSIGASANTVGTIFTATGVGTGITGTAKPVGVYAFSTTSGSNIVTCYFDNHGYYVGQEFYIGVATTLGGITIPVGAYKVLSVGGPSGTNPSIFTFAVGSQASSSAGPTAINSGNVAATYYVALGPSTQGQGFGVGGFGRGGFGTGTTQSGSSGTAITNVSDWTLDNFGENLISNPTGGPIYAWSPSGALSNAQIAGSSVPLVNDGFFIAMPQRQIVAWGSSFTLQQDPLLIRWSDIEDATSWIATATNQAGSYRIPSGSKIVTCIQGPQQGLIWTDLDLWAMQYVGAPLVYGFNKIGSNCGAISRKSVGQIGNSIYWMSQNQFFLLSNEGPKPLPCPVWDVIFQNLKTGNDSNGVPYTQHIRCGVNTQFNEIMWFYPSANSTNGENDSYVKYNTVLNQWDFGTSTSTTNGLRRSAWIDQSVLGPPIGAGTDNYIYQHETGNDAAYNGVNGLAMLSSMQTGFFSMAEGDNIMFVDQIWPDMKWGTYSGNQNANVNITLYWTNYATDDLVSTGSYAGYPNSAAPYSAYFPMTQATEYVSCRIRARLIAIDISSSDVGSFWRLGGIRYRAAPDGKY